MTNGKEYPKVDRVPEILRILQGEQNLSKEIHERGVSFDHDNCQRQANLTWIFSRIVAILEKNSDHAPAWIATPPTPSAAAGSVNDPSGNLRFDKKLLRGAFFVTFSSKSMNASANSDKVPSLTIGDAALNVSFIEPLTVIADTK
jgi:hypothetical protein